MEMSGLQCRVGNNDASEEHGIVTPLLCSRSHVFASSISGAFCMTPHIEAMLLVLRVMLCLRVLTVFQISRRSKWSNWGQRATICHPDSLSVPSVNDSICRQTFMSFHWQMKKDRPSTGDCRITGDGAGRTLRHRSIQVGIITHPFVFVGVLLFF